MTLLGIDLSHHNGVVNFPAVRRAGQSFVVLKATDGVGWTDSAFAANRAAAHAAGLAVGMYHFAEGGDPLKEAAWFLSQLGPLAVGEFLVLDWECSYAGDHVAWCKTWLDAVYAATGVHPLIYLNVTTMNAHNWGPVAADCGLWLARYDGSQAQPTVTSWAGAAMKQFTSSGTVPGVVGSVDCNVFYGDATALAAYGYQGADMPLTDADVQKLWWAATTDPVTNQPIQIINLLKNAALGASNAARDAAIARKLAESAAAGVVLTKAQIDTIASGVAADLATGYKIAVVPPSA